ncbi:MAG: hypothetical protein E4H17_03050 [Gemmatimonadales bacterium]|nr:MAG: hypothetical protein E4H17_03050 [Gemmatimonadales bacterium]
MIVNIARRMLLCLVLLAASTEVGAAPQLKVGDLATVKADKTPVRQGKATLAYLNKGQRVKIYHIQGGFARVYIKVKGKVVEGHVSVTDVEPRTRKEVEAVAAIYAEDDEVITTRQSKLMLGKEVLGKIEKETRLTVKKVNGDWLGVYAAIEGKRTWGWLPVGDVTYAPAQPYTGEKSEGEGGGASKK